MSIKSVIEYIKSLLIPFLCPQCLQSSITVENIKLKQEQV